MEGVVSSARYEQIAFLQSSFVVIIVCLTLFPLLCVLEHGG